MIQERMWNLTVLMCVVWALSILYGEMFAFWVPSLWACSWPHLHQSRSPSSTMNGVGYPDDYVKVVVLADPQLMDKTSHGLAPKSFALEISQFYTDLFMRRSFLASILPFNPDVILFLGDYFDGGPILSDEEWQESLSRFKHIFDLNTRQRKTNVQVYYIPGNHDVGYASLYSNKPEVVERYEKEFGIRNYRFTVGKVEFIAVDAQTLDGHLQKNETSASWNFVKNVSNDFKLNPRVLLTHIPLYRPDWTPCGPHRSSPTINQRISRAVRDQDIVYQNYVTEKSSNYLMDLIRPVLILSGHDHDQCTVTHVSKYGPIVEVNTMFGHILFLLKVWYLIDNAVQHTVGTISWQQGNLYPSFMLLSASNIEFKNASRPEDAVSTNLCFLPMQTHIYIWYLSLFVITLLALLFWPINGMGFWHHFSSVIGYARRLISCSVFRGGTKEKNEDEYCEYEMIWDAEGSMHLVKKALEAPFTLSSQRGLVERGNAVMRPTAKKQTSQEIEFSMTMDVNTDIGLDAMAKLASRTSKSKTRMIQRLVRTFRMLTVIAAVNFALYMILLFKDGLDV